MTSPDPLHALPAAWQPALAHSQFLRQLLAARPAGRGMARRQCWSTGRRHGDARLHRGRSATDDESLKVALRALRQRVMAALIVRDLGNVAPLAEVIETMTTLADVTTNVALDFIHRQLAAQFGEPLDGNGRPAAADGDRHGQTRRTRTERLIRRGLHLHLPEEGQTAGDRGRAAIDNYDFFNRLGKRLINALGELTADGRVFRVDMRLRERRLRPSGLLARLAGKLLHHAGAANGNATRGSRRAS